MSRFMPGFLLMMMLAGCGDGGLGEAGELPRGTAVVLRGPAGGPVEVGLGPAKGSASVPDGTRAEVRGRLDFRDARESFRAYEVRLRDGELAGREVYVPEDRVRPAP